MILHSSLSLDVSNNAWTILKHNVWNIDTRNDILKHYIRLSNSSSIVQLAINICAIHHQFIFAIYKNKEIRSVSYCRENKVKSDKIKEEQHTKVDGHAIINPAAWPIMLTFFSGRINWSDFANVASTRTAQNWLPRWTPSTLYSGSMLCSVPRATFLFGFPKLFKKTTVPTYS